jgi:hypothetical protein
MRIRRRATLGRATALILCGGVALASVQQGGMMQEAIQEKLAAIKASQAANKAALQKYGWVEIVQFSLNGQQRGTKQFSCMYGTDGQVIRTPMGDPSQGQQQQREGPLRRRIEEKKKDEMQDYMGQIRAAIGLYVPPDAMKMEQAFKAGNASLDRPGAGEAGLVIRNYAKPNDTMTLDFRMDTKKLAGLKVNSYLDDPSQPFALNVQFATLPDGTNYPATVILDAPSKAMQVTMTNANYQKRLP